MSWPSYVRVIFAALYLLGSADMAARLPRSAPEAQGISSRAILDFVQAADAQLRGLHSFMLVRHGQVVAEGWWSPYAAGDRHMLFSLSKSFASTAVGLAVAEGRLHLDDEVWKFFPEALPAVPGENLRAMRVRDLLTMSTGHHAETIANFPYDSPDDLTRLFLALPVAHEPGTHFVYNTPATYLCSALVQKVTGEKLIDYLRPRLLEPLGIDNAVWLESRQGVSLGGFGLSARTEDLACFGQLYLQEGRWQGRELLPPDWVKAATARQTSSGSDPSNDWEQGYGFQFWRCRHGLYRGDGAFGQFCIVFPEQDAVLVITSGVSIFRKGDQAGMADVMNLVWDRLLPAFQPEALSPDPVWQAMLADKLAHLALPPPEGRATTTLAAAVSGRIYDFASNDRDIGSISLEFPPGGAILTVKDAQGVHRIRCGDGTWVRGESSFVNGLENRRGVGRRMHSVAASGAWRSSDTYLVNLCLYETPFLVKLSFRFAGNELVFDSEYNVFDGPTEKPRLTGRTQ